MIKGVKTSMRGKRQGPKKARSVIVGSQAEALKKIAKYSYGPITMPRFMGKKGSAWKGGKKVR